MIKAFSNFVVFKTDTLFEDKVKFKGIGGKQLVLDPSFDPARHVRIYGEVVSLPIHLSKNIIISQQHAGLPSYHEKSPYKYKYLSDVVPEVKIGDRIYYHFNTIKTHNFVREEGVHPNRTWYVKVRLDQIICAVRDGVIIPIGGHCLIDPDFESWDDLQVPTYSDLVDKHGNKVLKPKEQWLYKKSHPGYKFLTGFVRHVGTPIKGDVCEIKVGQKILYRRNADWLCRIEDRDFFIIKQRHIEGRWEN